MKKKIIALGLSLVSVCIIFTGCAGLGKAESTTQAPESSSSETSKVYTLPPAGGSSSTSAGSSTNSSTQNSSAGVSVTPNITYASVPGSSNAASSTNTALGSYTINTQTDPLSLKLKPSKDAATIITVPKGTKVEVLAVQNGWGYIVYNTTGGWVSMQYLKPAA